MPCCFIGDGAEEGIEGGSLCTHGNQLQRLKKGVGGFWGMDGQSLHYRCQIRGA